MRCVPDEARAALITGLVMCSLMFLGLTLFTGRKRRPKPFLQTGPSGHDVIAADNVGHLPSGSDHVTSSSRSLPMKASSGLTVFRFLPPNKCRYFAVVLRLLCPRKAWISRMLSPRSSLWVAILCRRQ